MESKHLSFYAIPAYWILCLLPHGYAVAIAKKANNGRWQNSNPRSTAWDEKLRKSTPAEIFARYERAEAAHKNGFENLPVFIGAVLVGNMAKLDNSTMNKFVGAYLASRVLYTWLYISVSKNKTSFLRTGAWLVGVLMCLGVYVKSGLAMN